MDSGVGILHSARIGRSSLGYRAQGGHRTYRGIFGFFATKHLPLLTISASIKATRPAFVVLGFVLIFGERRFDALDGRQSCSSPGRTVAARQARRTGRQGIAPPQDAVGLVPDRLDAARRSQRALWDKFPIARYDRLAVQAYTCYYQSLMMIAIVMTMWHRARSLPAGDGRSIRAPKMLTQRPIFSFTALSIRRPCCRSLNDPVPALRVTRSSRPDVRERRRTKPPRCSLSLA